MVYRGICYDKSRFYNSTLEKLVMEARGISTDDALTIVTNNSVGPTGKMILRYLLCSGIKLQTAFQLLKDKGLKAIDCEDFTYLVKGVSKPKQSEIVVCSENVMIQPSSLGGTCMVGTVLSGVFDCMGSKMNLPVKDGVYVVCITDCGMNVTFIKVKENFVKPDTDMYTIVSNEDVSLSSILVPEIVNNSGCSLLYISEVVVNWIKFRARRMKSISPIEIELTSEDYMGMITEEPVLKSTLMDYSGGINGRGKIVTDLANIIANNKNMFTGPQSSDINVMRDAVNSKFDDLTDKES